MCTTAPITVGGHAGPLRPRPAPAAARHLARDAKTNYVDHTVTDQSSVLKFIEDNWLHGESTGAGSFANIAGSLDAPGGVLDFHTFPHFEPLILNPTTGAVVSGGGWQAKKD